MVLIAASRQLMDMKADKQGPQHELYNKLVSKHNMSQRREQQQQQQQDSHGRQGHHHQQQLTGTRLQ